MSALRGRDSAIVVVSGLPRSGTSMMMQMLAAGGVPVLADDARPGDASNPRGYFELAAVKHLHRDQRWLAAASGCAVKVVAPLLPALPQDRAYRVILMQRPIAQVLDSQQRMLERLGRREAAPPDGARLARALEAKLVAAQRWVEASAAAELLAVDYLATLADPRATADRVARFLGLPLEREAMGAVVEPQLYRERATS